MVSGVYTVISMFALGSHVVFVVIKPSLDIFVYASPYRPISAIGSLNDQSLMKSLVVRLPLVNNYPSYKRIII